MLEFLVNLQHSLWAHGVSGVAAVSFWLEEAKFKGGFARKMGIHEQNQLTIFQIQGMFDLELEIRKIFDIRESCVLQPFQQQRAKRVVATAGVAVTEN